MRTEEIILCGRTLATSMRTKFWSPALGKNGVWQHVFINPVLGARNRWLWGLSGHPAGASLQVQ